ncbi:MAG: FtsX-like permease family protein [Treponema sp.]|nr:FtsX-like permease family protein [Spirochaetia bacterium]MDD7458606.1 FtsX-like permease family protein [Spirochaetales bacterium]MDY5812333.1 FtsX-like permease family protein [Treponema sp.]MEE1182518.1 FtsX-like permease family protein [Treponema sp.]
MFFKLAVRNIFSRKSSLVIILFISFAVTLLVLVNSVFDSTENGVEQTFKKSLTGDFAIRPKSKVPLSLFGDETPVTGELTELTTLVPYTEICSLLNSFAEVRQTVPQVTGRAMMECNGRRIPVFVFGVFGRDYIEQMNAIKVIEGRPFDMDKKGCMISKLHAQQLGASVGDKIQFVISDGLSASIRTINVSCIFEYTIQNKILDNIVLADPQTVLSLMNVSVFTDSTVIAENKNNMLADDFNMEEMFNDVDDVSAVIEETTTEFFEGDSAAASTTEDEVKYSENTTWNFMTGVLAEKADSASFIRRINRQFKKQGFPVEAVSWRNAAGISAMYIYWIRIIFNAGILIILGTGLIIINNTLVVNILDRICEVGMMRAIGSTKNYIRLSTMLETCILTMLSGALGCIMGMVLAHILSRLHIELTNAFLIQLFGGQHLTAQIKLLNIVRSFSLTLLLGLVAWIYPVNLVFRQNPIQAIQGVK